MVRTSGAALLLVGLTTCACAQERAGEEFLGRIDINYSEANPDFSPFPNGEGISVYARMPVSQTFFANLRHSNVSFQPSGPVQGENVDVWQEVGLGYRQTLYADWTLEASASYQRLEQGSKTENGYEYQVGAMYTPFERLQFDLHIGQIDVQIDDWNLDFETRYRAWGDSYLVAKLRDYADWDFTYYEVGVGFYF